MAGLDQSAPPAQSRVATSSRNSSPASPVPPPRAPRPDAHAPKSAPPTNTRSRYIRAHPHRRAAPPPPARLPAAFRPLPETPAPGYPPRQQEFSSPARIFPSIWDEHSLQFLVWKRVLVESP